MKAYYTTQQWKTEKEKLGPISRQIKICVACGNMDIEEYEFGLSCERCGTSFYFGRVYHEEVN